MGVGAGECSSRRKGKFRALSLPTTNETYFRGLIIVPLCLNGFLQCHPISDRKVFYSVYISGSADAFNRWRGVSWRLKIMKCQFCCQEYTSSKGTTLDFRMFPWYEGMLLWHSCSSTPHWQQRDTDWSVCLERNGGTQNGFHSLQRSV